MLSLQNRRPLQGFTLVELSIVLVIIGLIVSSVLAGQALIRSAQLQAQITQMGNFSTAVGAFSTQFGNLPGDWSNNPAVSGYLTRAGTTGQGDENGAIQTDCASPYNAEGETYLFWADLSDAGLINFTSTFGNAGASVACGSASTTAATTSYLPPASYQHANRITVYGISGVNYYLISVLPSITVASGAYTASAGMMPLDAYNFDLKYDDGNPLGGTVLAAGPTPNGSAPPAPTAGTGAGTYCVTSLTAPSTYNTTNTSYLCALQIRMQ